MPEQPAELSEEAIVEQMRDCVAEFYVEGVTGGHSTKREARTLIALEMFRLGLTGSDIVSRLHSWNGRCGPPWHQAERRQCIDDFVLKWLAEKSEIYELSCNGERLRPYCFRDERFCKFRHRQRQRGNAFRADGVAELSRFATVWEPWLRAHHANASNIITVWKVLVRWVVTYDLSYRDVIYVGCRTIAAKASEWVGRPLTPRNDGAMAAWRAVRGLEEFGLVFRAQQGEGKRPRKALARKSNGYQLVLPLPDPPDLPEKTSEAEEPRREDPLED